MQAKDRILVALDTRKIEDLVTAAKTLGPHVGGFKIGLETLLSIGLKPALNAMRGYGPATENIFVDAKIHDIPNTMAGAVRAIVEHPQVKFVNVHASAGPEGIAAAASAKGQAKLLAVTLLTSFNDATAHAVYGPGDAAYHVARLAQIAIIDGCQGADGVVCSPQEARLVREMFKGRLFTVTPGIRPKWSAKDDQERVTTPAEAVRNGATYLVIGRPITNPPVQIGTPVAAAMLIAQEIAEALR